MKVSCPICRRVVEIADLSELKSFPFCSDRCKLVDLGRWIDGDYAVAVPATSEPEDEEEARSEPDATEEDD